MNRFIPIGLVSMLLTFGLVAGTAAADTGSAPTTLSSGVISASSVGAGDGAYQYYWLAYPGHNNTATVTLTFAPSDPTTANAVGVNAYQNGTLIQSMNGVGFPRGTHSMSFTSSSQQPVELQFYNFLPGVVVNYQISVTGFATSIAAVPTATPASSSANGLPASGTLAGGSSGSFANYTINYLGGPAQSVNLSFSPNNPTVSNGVYVTAYQNGRKIGQAHGTDAKTPGVLPVWYQSDSAGPVTIQIAYYTPAAPIGYYLSQ
jgi:hypothetical protein